MPAPNAINGKKEKEHTSNRGSKLRSRAPDAAKYKTLTEAEDIETLKKVLPHVDLETGLKNRTVQRDPITGLGTVSASDGEKVRPRTQSVGRKAYNPTLIAWDADTEKVEPIRPASSARRIPSRNPISLTGDLGEEVDNMRTTNRPRVGTPREPQRDPISGRGNFGDREWDPIWKYNGRMRRAKSFNGDRCNPLTGENVKTFTVNVEERQHGNKTLKNGSVRNIFTGENCSTYTVSPELKLPSKKHNPDSARNAITGENCASYDFNAEVRNTRKHTPVQSCNPLSGENMDTFNVSREERPRPLKPYVYKNTVTGENLASYKITPIERNVTAKVLSERQNPLSGENMKTYTYRVGEGRPAVKKRDISSPITGEGARGRTYTVSIEERPTSSGNTDGQGSRVRARSYGPTRNILTGENCDTFYVCKEMRSERISNSASSNGPLSSRANYNIITGVS
ncbi:Surface protein PspC [Fasciola hepatica]|uniref:Surface protein PspC n=1 Tax=Fasciola hepatica TaxID=6192 RepID=A0A4E0S2P0_FASHE|nr:Surface protein PspC [Fasciola hepatica]